ARADDGAIYGGRGGRTTHGTRYLAGQRSVRRDLWRGDAGAGTARLAGEASDQRIQKLREHGPTGFLINLAIPTFASALTIIDPECLTTVFGMGTGVSTTVWSREKARGAVKPARAGRSGVLQEWRTAGTSPAAH